MSDVIGMINYPSQRRALAGRGVTLIGDAGLVADYLWGVGCGWAFQSAEWLVDATAADLLRRQDLTRPLRRYARRMRRQLGPHHTMISDYATGRPFNALERLLRGRRRAAAPVPVPPPRTTAAGGANTASQPASEPAAEPAAAGGSA